MPPILGFVRDIIPSSQNFRIQGPVNDFHSISSCVLIIEFNFVVNNFLVLSIRATLIHPIDMQQLVQECNRIN